MISLRRHVLTLVAVFLALAIGVVLGSTSVATSIRDSLVERQESTEGQLETAQQELTQSRLEADRLDELAGELATGRGDGVAVVVIPPATAIASLAERAAEVGVVLGAQDCSVATPGACTGELPAELLYEVGARVVEIGHAERRARFGDTDKVVTQKVRIAVESGLTPIICVGEHTRSAPEAAARAVADQLSSAVEATVHEGRSMSPPVSIRSRRRRRRLDLYILRQSA